MTNKQIINLRKQIINTYKVSVGCCICGYNKNPSSLCFDHLPEYEKRDECRSGSKAGGMFALYSKKYHSNEIIEEIKKCRVLCCNCHMEVTHKNPQYINKQINNIKQLQIELLKSNEV